MSARVLSIVTITGEGGKRTLAYLSKDENFFAAVCASAIVLSQNTIQSPMATITFSVCNSHRIHKMPILQVNMYNRHKPLPGGIFFKQWNFYVECIKCYVLNSFWERQDCKDEDARILCHQTNQVISDRIYIISALWKLKQSRIQTYIPVQNVTKQW